MSTGDSNQAIRITAEDLADVQVAAATPQPFKPADPEGRSYGSITDASGTDPVTESSKGSILLQGWFYLGAAGLIGSLAGWAICEPGFVDGQGGFHWGNFFIVPVVVAIMTLGFGIAESLVERSAQKALIRTALALPLGGVLGFVFYWIANFVFAVGVTICSQLGVTTYRNPAFWITRAVAWTVFGVAGGVVYGIIGQSFKKAKFGVLGGMLGSALGGILFDPISMGTGGGAPSRAFGFALFGVATGIMMGIVESALKDRWFYVTAGPLAGKQFILYKQQTSIGSDQQADIYLFKDPSILPRHARIEANGTRMRMRALGPVFVSGTPVSDRVLLDGDLVQIGRYAFRYKEKTR
ncbi:MAG: FHA domain-containing protein [Acidobacteriaceae bacterium]|nr:FHA domain-containing protein [Acidobacteriaceae bacterium]